MLQVVKQYLQEHRIFRNTVIVVAVVVGVTLVSSLIRSDNSSVDATSKGVKTDTTVVADSYSVTETLLPDIEKKPVFAISDLPYQSTRVNDASLAVGTETIKTAGKQGRRVATYDALFVNGKEVGRTLVSDLVTFQPVNEVVAVGIRTENACAFQVTINRDGESICIKRDKKNWRDWFRQDT